MKTGLSILFLFIAFSCLGQKRVFYGTVVDLKTGEPLPYTTITLKTTNFQCVTDEKGRFLITDVPQGQNEVEVNYFDHHFMTTEFKMFRKGYRRIDFQLLDRRIPFEPDPGATDNSRTVATVNYSEANSKTIKRALARKKYGAPTYTVRDLPVCGFDTPLPVCPVEPENEPASR